MNINILSDDRIMTVKDIDDLLKNRSVFERRLQEWQASLSRLSDHFEGRDADKTLISGEICAFSQSAQVACDKAFLRLHIIIDAYMRLEPDLYEALEVRYQHSHKTAEWKAAKIHVSRAVYFRRCRTALQTILNFYYTSIDALNRKKKN